MSGNVVIKITNTGTPNALLNGLFIDAAATTSATFLKKDTTTEGSWDRHLWNTGIRHRQRPHQPPFLRHGHAQRPDDLYLDDHVHRPTWLAGARLQQSHRGSLVRQFQLHGGCEPDRRPGTNLELYFVDWDSRGRTEQVQISNTSGTVLDTEQISSFSGGEYLDWTVSGDVVIKITNTGAPNALLNGVFIDGVLSGASVAEVAAVPTGGGAGADSTTLGLSVTSDPVTAGSASIGEQQAGSTTVRETIHRSSVGFARSAPVGWVDAVLGALTDDVDGSATGAHANP